MIIWGWQTRSIDLGQQQIQHCSNCRQLRPFRLAFQYTFFRLYCLFGMVTSKRYIRQLFGVNYFFALTTTISPDERQLHF